MFPWTSTYKFLCKHIFSFLLGVLLNHSSCVRLRATPETAAHQAPRPWDSPGKNIGVGCHFLLQCMKVKSESEVAQPCPTLSDPTDCMHPIRLLRPWDFPGKSTGVGCHCLLHLLGIYLLIKVELLDHMVCLCLNFRFTHAKSLQSCLTLCDPMDCSLPGSSVHGILQAGILEGAAMLPYFSKVAATFYILTSRAWVFQFVCILTNTCVYFLL